MLGHCSAPPSLWSLMMASCVLVLFHAAYSCTKIESRVKWYLDCNELAEHLKTEIEPAERYAEQHSVPFHIAHIWDRVRDKVGCSGYLEVHYTTCKCEIHPEARNVLGGSLVEMVIARSLIVVALFFAIFAIFQRCKSSWRCPSRATVATHTSLSKVLLHIRACCLAFGRRLLILKDEEVRREAQKQRCRYAAELLSPIIVVVVVGFSVLAVYLNVVVITRCETEPFLPDRCVHDLREHLLGGWILPISFISAIVMALSQQSVPTPASLDYANIAFSCMWIWRYCTLPRDWYQYHSSMIWASRTVQGLFVGNCRLSVVLHWLVTCVDIFMSTWTLHDGPRGDMGSVLGYIFAQLVVFSFVAALTWSFENLMVSEAEALLEARRLNCVTSMVQRLLSALCDCTVHLDSELCLVEPCPKLAGLLMRPSSGTTSVGKPFLDLLAPDDRLRFSSHIAEQILAQRLSNLNEWRAYPLHLSLLDVNHCRVSVEVFSSFIEVPEGPSFHIVGIREEEPAQPSDPPNAAEAHVSSTSVPDLSMMMLPINQKRRMQCLLENSSCSSSDTGSKLSTDGMEDIACILSLAQVIAGSEKLPMIDCSIGFSIMFGPSLVKGMDLSEFVQGGMRNGFFLYIQDAVNAHVNQQPMVAQIFPVRLYPPWLGHQNISIKADVSLIINLDVNDVDDAEDLLPESVTACFHSIKWRQSFQRRNRKRYGRYANLQCAQQGIGPRPHSLGSGSAIHSSLKL